MNPFKHFIFYLLLFLFPTIAFTQSNNQQGDNASILKKEISGTYRNETLENIILDINERYKIHFSYVNELVPLSSKVYLSAKALTLSKALDEMLKNTFIQYYLVGDQIVLIEEKVIDSLGLNKPAGVKNSLDSVRVYSLEKKYKGKRRKSYNTYKISDLFKGSLSLSLNNGLLLPYRAAYARTDSIVTDSLNPQKDSLKNISKPRYNNSEQIISKNLPLPKAEPTGKFSLNIFMTPEFSNWKMFSNTANLKVKDYNDYGQPELGVTFGSTFDYFLSKKISFSSGLFVTGINKTYTHSDHFASAGSPEQVSIKSSTSSSSYNYLALPFLVGIKLREKKMGMILYTGYIFNFFSSQSGASNYQTFYTQYSVISGTNPFFTTPAMNKPVIPQTIVYRKLDVSFYLNLQLSFKLSKRLQFIVGPSFNIFKNSINVLKDAPVRERLGLFGIKNGLRYNF